MINSKTYYHRNLPHYQPLGYTYFVTFRLYDSLPIKVVEKLKTEYKIHLETISAYSCESEKRNKYSEGKWNYFVKFDSNLDLYSNNNWLKDERIAKLVYDSILYRDNKEYELIGFTIMPNHIHMVFSLVEQTNCSLYKKTTKLIVEQADCTFENEKDKEQTDYSLYKVMQSLKWYTAKESNKILKRNGQFWQHESYDHVVRNEEELNRIIKYVLNNPVKAELVEKLEDWEWNYCKYL